MLHANVHLYCIAYVGYTLQKTEAGIWLEGDWKFYERLLKRWFSFKVSDNSLPVKS